MVDAEISYIESKIKTLQVQFNQDKANSYYRPSQHLRDVSIIQEICFELVPLPYPIWSKRLSKTEFLSHIDILINTLTPLDVDQNVKDELSNDRLKYQKQEFEHNITYLELRQIEFSILFDLHIKQSAYKERDQSVEFFKK